MQYYHSTLKIRLEEILKSDYIEPGKESPENPAYSAEWMFLGIFRESSPRNIYFWDDFEKAKECAEFISSHARREYSSEGKKPVVIEINIRDTSKISSDPHSSGFMHFGPVNVNKFTQIYVF